MGGHDTTWRVCRFNGSPAFAEHIPIYVHTYFIRCPAAEYAIQKSGLESLDIISLISQRVQCSFAERLHRNKLSP